VSGTLGGEEGYVRPPKRIDRTPKKAATPSGTRTFRKGRSFVPPEDVELTDAFVLDDEVSPLPTGGEAPPKWEARTGLPSKHGDDVDPVIDLRSSEATTVDIRTTVRIVDGMYYERRTSGFRSRSDTAATA
jgi:hypothetical protein